MVIIIDMIGESETITIGEEQREMNDERTQKSDEQVREPQLDLQLVNIPLPH